ncbi:hypothetical protein AGMMS49960_21040 [Betaproteobacteria bacterium]|nr:hypothetical protein AGMMS49543_19180 [Betaproteobacteria bacterium]GHU04864.1 hypothetical protein AGMMS49960_21040 [Betaproteobacteria bacterium]GHU22333.1 hypothetical protein AGMMS50243_21700 [Betaproteobacteria bacterium]
MKKKFLAVNVALALGAMSGLAVAATSNFEDVVTATTITGNTQRVALPGNVVVAEDYTGLINIVPYYSVQEGNTVALSITNNDTLNGKVLKVRFRSAEWSDDVLDFQVFLSPGDIWTAALTKEYDSVTDQYVAKLNKSEDKTCTRPQIPAGGVRFHADQRVEGTSGHTLEGYVEIITLADIPPRLNGADAASAGADLEFAAPERDDQVTASHVNPLYTVTKHVNGTPPCATEDIYKSTIDSLIQDSYWTYPAVGQTISDAAGHVGVHLYNVIDDQAVDNTNGDWNGWAAPEQPVTTGGGVKPAKGAWYNGKGQFGRSAKMASDDWLQFPTDGISSYVSVINVGSRKAYTLQATALKNVPVIDGVQSNAGAFAAANTDGFFYTSSVENRGTNRSPRASYLGSIKSYFDQNAVDVDWAVGEGITADKIFGKDGYTGYGVTPTGLAGLQLLEVDLPDLSTPTRVEVAEIDFANSSATTEADIVVAGGVAYPGGPAAAQRDLVAAALQADGFRFEYVTNLGLNASTDIVLNQPVRRYYYWYTEVTTPTTSDPGHRVFTSPSGLWNVAGELNTPYSSLSGKGNSIVVRGTTFYDREERTFEAAPVTGSIFSPAQPSHTDPTGLKGEVSVLAINSTTQYSEALSARLTKNDLPSDYRDGWGYFDANVVSSTGGRPGANGYGFSLTNVATQHHALLNSLTNLPFIAYSAINVYSPASGAVYGTTLPVRLLRK